MLWFNKKNLRYKVDLYYEILAGGARTKLLESIVNFNLAEIVNAQGTISEIELIETLNLHPLRAKKWLFLLTRENFLCRHKNKYSNTYRYSLGPILSEIFINNNYNWWFFKQMVYSWQTVTYENFYNVLQGSKVNITYQWPPRNKQESIAIENWMANTILAPFKALCKAINFNKVQHLLDIGGGDGSMACELAKNFSKLKITVYNLPTACQLARNKVMEHNLSNRINVIEGDFLVDNDFPLGHDLILFSRVLCDWSPNTVSKLLLKAYNSINKTGKIAICEPFQEYNKNFALAWEFRYIFWDEFETEVFKTSSTYKKILRNIGFKIYSLSKPFKQSIYSVLLAHK